MDHFLPGGSLPVCHTATSCVLWLAGTSSCHMKVRFSRLTPTHNNMIKNSAWKCRKFWLANSVSPVLIVTLFLQKSTFQFAQRRVNEMKTRIPGTSSRRERRRKWRLATSHGSRANKDESLNWFFSLEGRRSILHQEMKAFKGRGIFFQLKQGKEVNQMLRPDAQKPLF